MNYIVVGMSVFGKNIKPNTIIKTIGLDNLTITLSQSALINGNDDRITFETAHNDFDQFTHMIDKVKLEVLQQD